MLPIIASVLVALRRRLGAAQLARFSFFLFLCRRKKKVPVVFCAQLWHRVFCFRSFSISDLR
jgi:hypothetical protein